MSPRCARIAITAAALAVAGCSVSGTQSAGPTTAVDSSTSTSAPDGSSTTAPADGTVQWQDCGDCR